MGDEREDGIPVILPPELAEALAAAPPLCNRISGRSAAEANLNGAPYGFKATGDAAWDSDSADYAMFSDAGNLAVAEMVRTARILTRGKPEADVLAWLDAEKARLKASTECNPWLPHLPSARNGEPHVGHAEVTDTMVRETVAYALDEAWQVAYGHRFGEDGNGAH